MNCRTTIAVIDHNMGLNRGHKLDKDGKLMYKKVYSKVSSQWIPKAVYNPKNYFWMPMLMKMCVVQKEATTLPPVPVKDRGNIAPVPAPPTREMISKLISRFRKAYDDS
ncbi:hypothetical protein FSP39_016458 [Pinctada imbricata]|uniref:Uncharacterized protein n=1 Tax=Pinctada imbricata TaxID=66713 RepID=A0AA89CA44_PINIB|nr:hypothetical protein FSP39_016458 [Pinctada imbricata]